MQRQAVFFGTQPHLSEIEFDRLFLEYYQRIAATAYRLVGDPDEAEDLAAEAFWKLWQTPPATTENLAGWLYRTVINLGYNRLRSSRRRSGYEIDSAGLGNSPEPDPQDESERRQEAAAVRVALRALPERDVQILILHASSFSYKEIASALNLSLGSVGTLLARAERKFESRYSGGNPHAPQR